MTGWVRKRGRDDPEYRREDRQEAMRGGPYLKQLRDLAETDPNRVVRIHCLGAIKKLD